MGSSIRARLKALSKGDSSTEQQGLVIAPAVSLEDQTCCKALDRLVNASKIAKRDDLLLPPSEALPLIF